MFYNYAGIEALTVKRTPETSGRDQFMASRPSGDQRMAQRAPRLGHDNDLVMLKVLWG